MEIIMNKQTDAYDWYDIWMQQSRHFFESASEHLKTLFTAEVIANPEAHLKQIQAWLESLTSRWQQTQKSHHDEQFQPYWQMIAKMYQESTDLMLNAWLQKNKSAEP